MSSISYISIGDVSFSVFYMVSFSFLIGVSFSCLGCSVLFCICISFSYLCPRLKLFASAEIWPTISPWWINLFNKFIFNSNKYYLVIIKITCLKKISLWNLNKFTNSLITHHPKIHNFSVVKLIYCRGLGFYGHQFLSLSPSRSLSLWYARRCKLLTNKLIRKSFRGHSWPFIQVIKIIIKCDQFDIL